jgi:chlorite dismutase
MAAIVPVTFTGGDEGEWCIDRLEAVTGPPLARAKYLAVREGHARDSSQSQYVWQLRGTAGHVRYVERVEQQRLSAVQAPLGRRDATRDALIPIKKSDAWWELAHDERRAIFESASHHISASLKYLPAIARRLYHSRDLGEPFDFLTWFEFAPHDADGFEELVTMLRATEEWKYVEREVDIRLSC